jgi:hypothetical protein
MPRIYFNDFHKSVKENVIRDFHHFQDMLFNVPNENTYPWSKSFNNILNNVKNTGKITEKQVHKLQNDVYKAIHTKKKSSKKSTVVSKINSGDCKVTLRCFIGNKNRKYIEINNKKVYLN